MLRLAPHERLAAAEPAVPDVRSRAPGVETMLLLVAVAAAVAPIVVATVRALDRGWLPIGDNAYFAIRARDVFTEHHPLLGTWTSASLSVGTNLNNPGPLLFDLFALPAKLAGPGGVAIGAAVLNVLAVVGIAVLAHRRGGPLAGVLAMVTAAALGWSMGSELLFDPWQPHSLLFTFLLLIFLAWSLASGDVAALPWTAVVASLIVQTHLSYAVLVAALVVWGVGWGALDLRRRRGEDPERWARLRTATTRAVAAAAVVSILCWAQPVAEQLRGEGEGNLSRIAGNAGAAPATIGPALGTQVVAKLAVRPWWLRPSFERALQYSEDPSATRLAGVPLPELPSRSTSAASFGVVGLVLLAVAVASRRAGHRSGTVAVLTAGVVLAAGVLTATILPVGPFGIPPHQVRWLWPISAFLTFAVVSSLVALAAATRRATGLVAAGTLLTVAVAVLNVPSYNVEAGPTADADAIPSARRLSEGMVALEGDGPLLLDIGSVRFNEPYSGPVMAELQRRDIPFVVDDEGMVRQLGPSRRAEPGADRLVITEGDGAMTTPPGWRRAVLVEGLADDEQAELAELAETVLARLEEIGQAPLNEEGEAALAAGSLPVAADRPEVLTADLPALLATRELSVLIERGWLDLGPDDRGRFTRYAALQERWDRHTVALFVAPPEGG